MFTKKKEEDEHLCQDAWKCVSHTLSMSVQAREQIVCSEITIQDFYFWFSLFSEWLLVSIIFASGNMAGTKATGNPAWK